MKDHLLTHGSSCLGKNMLALHKHVQAVVVDYRTVSWPVLQVTPSFKALTQVHPDLTMSFVSDVAKKMGLPCKDTDRSETDLENAVPEDSQASLPDYIVSSPNNCSTNMDIDSNRRQL